MKQITLLLLAATITTTSFAQADKHKGEVVFFNKKIDYHNPSGDNESNYLQEYTLGEPLYFRAYFSQQLKDVCADCDYYDVRFSANGVTYTSEQFRGENMKVYSYSSAAGAGYYVGGGAAGVPLISDRGWYYEQYDLVEDAFRMFLNKLGKNVKIGATIPVKVEVLSAKETKVASSGTLLASGTLNVKVTDKVKDLSNFVTRASAATSNAEMEKAIGDRFKASLENEPELKVDKVYKTILVSTENVKRNSLTGYPESKNIDASVIYKRYDGSFWVTKTTYVFEYDGTAYAKIPRFGKLAFQAPIVACAVE